MSGTDVFRDSFVQFQGIGAGAAGILIALLVLLAGTVAVLARKVRRLRSQMSRRAWLGEKINAWSTFAGRSVRAPGNKGTRQSLLRVKLYVDHSNFFRYWRNLVEGSAPVDTLDWPRLPETVLGAVKNLPLAQGKQVVYCGTNLYFSFHEDAYYDLLVDIKTGKEKSPLPLDIEIEEIERWRGENRRLFDEMTQKLPFQFGFFVFPFARQIPSSLRNTTFRPNGVPPTREKLVDTSLCTDLIADAVGDLYDVGLVLSADIDCSPAIVLVQEEYKKPIGVVGIRGTATGDLSKVCSFGIDLNEKVNGVPRYEAMRRPRALHAAEG